MEPRFNPVSPPNWFDFNDAAPLSLFTNRFEEQLTVEEIKESLHERLKDVLFHLFPAGKIVNRQFVVGNVHGDKGKSLKVELTGPKKGFWHDFATREGGDILSLWGAAQGLDSRHQFSEIMHSIHDWLGMSKDSLKDRPQSLSSPAFYDESLNLGPPTGSWNYEDAEGNLLACVYRYDTSKGKQFRPWDVKTRFYKTPEPRPLYNQKGMAKSEDVIFVEGEKCAQTLIDLGFCATTAMNGAQAPLDKTDWLPLKGKQVIIWPDNDKVGQAYADNLIKKLPTLGVAALSRVIIPEDKPESWDAADAHQEGMDIVKFLDDHTQHIRPVSSYQKRSKLPAFKVTHILADPSLPPEDLIGPRILTPGGLLVLGGAPKVGKTDMMLSWLAHMAAGLPFLGMTPPRPLKIFYLQTEIMYPYLKERLQNLRFDQSFLSLIGENLVITSQTHFVLNEEGVECVYSSVKDFFHPEELDVLVIDPLRNVYDAGKPGSENDNTAMLSFLRERVEVLRSMLNPNMGVILTHHTKKVTKSMVEEDPFQALSGAASLRSFYTTGMLLFRADEQQSVRQLMFELRNGESIQTKSVDKIDGTWREMTLNSDRIVCKEYGEKLDTERRRRHDVILQVIFDEGRKGKLYTPTQFCQAFENYGGLGGKQTIQNRLGVLTTKGYIKFNKDDRYRIERSKYGVLCVEGMEVPLSDRGGVDSETGEVISRMQPFLPTHFKESQSGAILPVENPKVWVYLDDMI